MYAADTQAVDQLQDGETIQSKAAEYVRAKWAAFVALEPKIHDMMHRAAIAAQAYRAQGKPALETAAKALILELGELSKLHGRIVDKFRDLAPYVGLGVVSIPVVLATAFSTAAIVLLWFFRKMEIQEKALDQLEAGTLSEAGFIEMNRELGASPLRETFDFAKLALWAFLAWLGFQVFQTMPRRNPPLVVFSNPPGLLSGDVKSLAYIHADDGIPYIHDFEGGVEAEALPDGSVLLSHPSKRIWRDFT